jgi:dienelactone hydrolase
MHPLALTANYLVQSHDAIVMVGFSGGGWETTLYAAIDPRIERSYPVAGSLPSYLRSQRDWGDYEQFSPRLYDAANYLELYVLGASEGRSQLQILNRYDSCCFAGEGYKTYETVVASRARALGGTFSVYSDDTHTVHQLSGRARDIILSDLLKVYPDAAQ